MHIFFKPSHSGFMIFHAKIGILGEYLYVSHTLFILFLEGNHTLFREKLYLIWKFSSGNTDETSTCRILHNVENYWKAKR